jgi:hypothetical protein
LVNRRVPTHSRPIAVLQSFQPHIGSRRPGLRPVRARVPITVFRASRWRTSDVTGDGRPVRCVQRRRFFGDEHSYGLAAMQPAGNSSAGNQPVPDGETPERPLPCRPRTAAPRSEATIGRHGTSEDAMIAEGHAAPVSMHTASALDQARPASGTPSACCS